MPVNHTRLLSTTLTTEIDKLIAVALNKYTLEEIIKYFQLPHKPVFITTPIYYINAGHLYSSLLADALNRHYIQLGASTIFSTGTDEHGQKIQQAANKAKQRPQVFSDSVSKLFKDMCSEGNINYTRFIRTTDSNHKQTVIHLWNLMTDRGYIHLAEHSGWYSISDEAFITEKNVREEIGSDGTRVKVNQESGAITHWVKEDNYKFKLNLFVDNLRDWLKRQPLHPASKVNTLLNDLSQLSELSVSRPYSRLHWAIPVPGNESQTIYVWLDALANYLTASGYPWKDNDINCWPPDYHIVGKDILKFHAIYWPSFLLACNLPLPRMIVAHGHWLVDDEKMSKSKGNIVDPHDKITKYGVDAFRYFLLKEGRLDDDTVYTENRVIQTINVDLADTLGNLLSRTTSKNLNPSQSVPSFERREPVNDDVALMAKIKAIPEIVDRYYRLADISKGIRANMELCQELNKYFETQKPWVLKKANEINRLNEVLSLTMSGLRSIATLLLPVMPDKMNQLLSRLAIAPSDRTIKILKANTESIKRFCLRQFGDS